MGGCCCCSSRRLDQDRNPTYYYCPRVSEEHQPLSAHCRAATVFSTGLLVDTNLDTSSPNTYRSPPAPLPYDVDLGRPHNPSGLQEFCGNKNGSSVEAVNHGMIERTVVGFPPELPSKCKDLKESECKIQNNSDASLKQPEIEFSKSSQHLVASLEEEDTCPICLDGYDLENPQIVTKCEHHFHLACILEWMERSEACPVCDKKMVFSPALE